MGGAHTFSSIMGKMNNVYRTKCDAESAVVCRNRRKSSNTGKEKRKRLML